MGCADEKSMPREKWPLWARVVAERAVPGEAGVGSTMHRLAGTLGLAFESFYQRVVGKSCGCAARAESLDERYPYA